MTSKQQKNNYKFSVERTEDKHHARLVMSDQGSSLKDIISTNDFYYYTIKPKTSNELDYTLSISKINPTEDNYYIRFFNQQKSYFVDENSKKLLKNLRVDFSSSYAIDQVDPLINKILKKFLIYQNFI